MNIGDSILFVESTKPMNPSMGGSFKSLRVLVECTRAQGYNVSVSFYFDNPLRDFFCEKGIATKVLPYHAPLSGKFGKKKADRPVSVNKNNKKKTFSARVKKYLSRFYEYSLAVINCFSIIKLVRDQGIAVIYCNTGITIDRAAILAGVLTGKKVICHLRNLPELGYLDKWLMGKVGSYIAISDIVLKHHMNSISENSNYLMMHNALGTMFEAETREIGRFVASQGGDFRVGCFSRLIAWKGVAQLIDGFHAFLAHGGKGTLVVCGEGPQLKSLTDKVAKKSMTEHVNFIPYTENVADLMRSCSVVVSPSIALEPLGRVPMEAGCLGVPVIATDIGGHRETIKDGVNGILYEPGDTKALGQLLFDLYKDPDRRVELAKNGMSESAKWRTPEYCKKLNSFLVEI